jgi:hypothetical protein
MIQHEEINRIMKTIKEHEIRIKRLEDVLIRKPKGTEDKALSIKEFILSKKPKNSVQCTLTIAYYLEKYTDIHIYNAKDLESGFRKAKESVPKNINLTIFRNAEKGYFMEAKDKKDGLKAWTLTNSGEKYVENNFKKEQATS